MNRFIRPLRQACYVLALFFAVNIFSGLPAFADSCDLALGGSYSLTCRECYVEEPFLKCECQRANHDKPWKATQIAYRTCQDNSISNTDGDLTCPVRSSPCGSSSLSPMSLVQPLQPLDQGSEGSSGPSVLILR